ncbi:hypothetical protein OIE51_15380 [Streptomyces sp. NBC_01803]|nr:hypothetical protein OIE51_15380 [Streptomyces sp. NBC_01803]
MAGAGRPTTRIAETLPLAEAAQAAQAHERLAKGGPRGRLVLVPSRSGDRPAGAGRGPPGGRPVNRPPGLRRSIGQSIGRSAARSVRNRRSSGPAEWRSRPP